MSPEAQRIAIAEACGWTECTIDTGIHPENRGQSYALRNQLPNYLYDLNAMHEAFVSRKWSLAQEHDYRDFLFKAVELSPYYKGHICYLELNRVANATALQRAEAFLKSLGLWKP